MSDTIFSKIITGQLPAYKLYEDDKTIAFLDIHPVQPGHSLIVPKQPVEFVWDLDEPDYENLMETVQKVALRLRNVLQVPYVGSRIFGLDVPHAHVHLIPFTTANQFNRIPDMTADPDHAALAEMLQKLSL